jgi:hypothetical protein
LFIPAALVCWDSVGLIIFSTAVASNHPQMAVFSFLLLGRERKGKKEKKKSNPSIPGRSILEDEVAHSRHPRSLFSVRKTKRKKI